MKDIKSDLYKTIDVILYIKDRKLKEVFYDPIFLKKAKTNLCDYLHGCGVPGRRQQWFNSRQKQVFEWY
ncbi:hypothetical protein [Nitrosomonas eutropha]|nr:hypothetical protein [Nitrosomonas eutropha]